MTIDGSGDDSIKIQGVSEQYVFTDTDGGSEGAPLAKQRAQRLDVIRAVCETCALILRSSRLGSYNFWVWRLRRSMVS